MAASAHGASAFAVGSDIYFGTGQYRPGTAEGDWLIAHELAHTVQQKSIGQVGIQSKTEVGAAYDEYEAEADQVADCAMQGSKYTQKVQPLSGARIQRFAPDGHRKAGAQGLKTTFSAEEIGLIYQSNWERDFSQGPPAVADMVVSWKLVKESAAKNHGNPSTSLASQFKDKAWAVLDMNLGATDESMGGYQPWEHMDHPGKKKAKQAEKRMEGQSRQMPAYLDENTSYVMDLMVRAVEQYWKAQGRPQHGISNWHYATGPAATTPPKPTGLPTLPRDVIGRESTEYAKSIGARSEPLALDKHGQPVMTASAGLLGRAMHCIEDFFSHSNWLDLAQQVRKGKTIQREDLQSGTFELPDKCHALGHKLLALSSSLLQDFDLLLKVFGRTTEHQPTPLERAALSIDMKPMRTDSWTPVGEIVDVYATSTLLEADVRAGYLSLESILCNRSVLEQIRTKGLVMIQEGHKESPDGGHGKLAKDQPEQGKDFATAHLLAVQANALIIAPLKLAMESKDSDHGAQILAQQLAVARQVLAPPSASHPLIHFVNVAGK